jgi:hypothetical protein
LDFKAVIFALGEVASVQHTLPHTSTREGTNDVNTDQRIDEDHKDIEDKDIKKMFDQVVSLELLDDTGWDTKLLEC